MGQLTVAHQGDDRFTIAVRGHEVRIDQPVDDHGSDTGPTPVELLVGALGSCVAHYARRYLRRHELPQEGLRVDASWESATSPSRVGTITLVITLPPGVPEERRAPLLAVASHCTVHNSFEHPPAISVALA
ncbi:MAG TPA: OsmC family protein [Mycobacteriales bacterium]|nr:OsmC family protein [Mycobacteriales bacterium]